MDRNTVKFLSVLFFFILILCHNTAFATTLSINAGMGGIRDSGKNYFNVDAGVSLFQPLWKDSGAVFDYDIIYSNRVNRRLEIYQKDHYLSSKFSFGYKYYLSNRCPSVGAANGFYPFLQASPSVFIYRHEKLLPGGEIHLGADFLGDAAGWLPYFFSNLFKTKVVYTIDFWGGFYHLRDKNISAYGIKIYSGMVF